MNTGWRGATPTATASSSCGRTTRWTEGKRVAFAAAEIPPRLKNSYAEVEDILRLGKLDLLYCKVNEQKVEGDFMMLSVDTTLTRFFDYHAAEGNLEQALREPGKMALSAACARSLFGGKQAVGKQVEVHMRFGETRTYEVAAVLKERGQSLMRFDMLIAHDPDFFWGGLTLLKLSKGTNAARLADKINADKVPTMLPDQTKYYLDPLEAVCFTTSRLLHHARRRFATSPRLHQPDARADALHQPAGSGADTGHRLLQLHQHEPLAPAATAPHDPRGEADGQHAAQHPPATRLQLFGDAFLTVVLAFLLSILLVNDCLAVFNGLLGSRLTMGFFFSSQMLPWLLVFILVMSVIPAWYISRRLSRLSFSQYRTLYGGRRKQRFVAVLVTVQFAISIGLLLATLVARNQMSLTERQASRYENCIEIGDAFGAKPSWKNGSGILSL